jgi:hypothetical protein
LSRGGIRLLHSQVWLAIWATGQSYHIAILLVLDVAAEGFIQPDEQSCNGHNLLPLWVVEKAKHTFKAFEGEPCMYIYIYENSRCQWIFSTNFENIHLQIISVANMGIPKICHVCLPFDDFNPQLESPFAG